MGGPSLSLTDTPSGSLSCPGLEFHPLGGVAITASNRDFGDPASPEFTCRGKLTTVVKRRGATSLLFPVFRDHESLADLIRVGWFTDRTDIPHRLQIKCSTHRMAPKSLLHMTYILSSA